MRILVIGGTRFIGRHLVQQAVRRDHHVTVFHRGQTAPGLFADTPGVQVRFGDRDADLSALATEEWDATVDTCAYVPRQVHALADVLGRRGGHHLIVSSVSAYANPGSAGFTEDAPLAELPDPSTEHVTAKTYGGLKVLCERAAVERYGEQTIRVRPTYVVGPDDYTWRYPWWVVRIARGGRVLAPEPGDAPAQVIDVRDLAAWMVRLLERGESGAFHAASPPPPHTWADQLEEIRRAVAPADTELVWVDRGFLLERGVDDATLPLWSADDPDVLLMAADPARAFATGLRPRPIEQTVCDTLAWARTVQMPPGTGLAEQREVRLLAEWERRAR